MAMISAISEMLWEDVFCQSKRLMTDYIGQEDIAFSQKKVQSAADMLRVAFIDFYRGLGMLKSFRFHTFSTFETLALGTLIFCHPIVATCHFLFLSSSFS
jgi:hypothetical protein